jgi:hypothetical protein
LHAFIFSMRATCPAHLILLNFITLMLFTYNLFSVPSHLRLRLPSHLFSSRFRPKCWYAFLICLMLATCPAYVLDFITLIISGKKDGLKSSSLFSYFYPSVPCSSYI